jgi:hypothetical protein
LKDWQVTTAAIIVILIVAVIVLSIMRPSTRIRFGVFFERDIEKKDPPDDDAPTDEWPQR